MGEITHYFIVLVFGGKAPLRVPPPSSPPSLPLSHTSLVWLQEKAGAGSSLAPRQWNTSNQPAQALSQAGWQSHTHTNASQPIKTHRTKARTEQDKQDIPAAGCSGFLATVNLNRRDRGRQRRSWRTQFGEDGG